MTRKSAPKAKLTDAERHKRFVDMAREVEASHDPKEFELAFKKVIRSKMTKKTREKAESR